MEMVNGSAQLYSGTAGHNYLSPGGWASGIADKSLADVKYFVFDVTNPETLLNYWNIETTNSAGVWQTLSFELAKTAPVKLVTREGVVSDALVSDWLGAWSRAVIEVPANFDGYIVIPVAAIGSGWNTTTNDFDATATWPSLGSFMCVNSYPAAHCFTVHGVYACSELPQ